MHALLLRVLSDSGNPSIVVQLKNNIVIKCTVDLSRSHQSTRLHLLQEDCKMTLKVLSYSPPEIIVAIALELKKEDAEEIGRENFARFQHAFAQKQEVSDSTVQCEKRRRVCYFTDDESNCEDQYQGRADAHSQSGGCF